MKEFQSQTVFEPENRRLPGRYLRIIIPKQYSVETRRFLAVWYERITIPTELWAWYFEVYFLRRYLCKHSYFKTVFCWGSPKDFWRYVVWKNSNPETVLSLRIWSRFSVEVFKNSYPETVLSRRRPEDFWRCGMKEFQFRNGFEPEDFLRRYLRILIPKQC